MKKYLVLLLLSLSFPLSAAENASSVVIKAAPIGSSLTGMVLSLFTLLGVLLGVYWLSRRLLTQRLGRGRMQSMQILSITMVGPKEKIIVLNTRAGEALVVGVTSQQITLLDKRPFVTHED
jgi:flagellar biosynthetic protein FliO